MKRLVAGLVLITALLAVMCSPGKNRAEGNAVEAAQPKYPHAALAKPFTPTLGDMIALSTGQYLTGLKAVSAPTITAYDRDSQKVQIAVFGQASTIDAAKKTLDDLRGGLDEGVLGSIYHVGIEEKDFQFYYYDVSGDQPKEVVHWADGQYSIPD